MILQLIIHEKIVEEVEITIDNKDHVTFTQRSRIIDDYRNYFKRKYAVDMMITNNWTIVLLAKSKMNSLNEQTLDDRRYSETRIEGC